MAEDERDDLDQPRDDDGGSGERRPRQGRPGGDRSDRGGPAGRPYGRPGGFRDRPQRPQGGGGDFGAPRPRWFERDREDGGGSGSRDDRPRGDRPSFGGSRDRRGAPPGGGFGGRRDGGGRDFGGGREGGGRSFGQRRDFGGGGRDPGQRRDFGGSGRDFGGGARDFGGGGRDFGGGGRDFGRRREFGDRGDRPERSSEAGESRGYPPRDEDRPRRPFPPRPGGFAPRRDGAGGSGGRPWEDRPRREDWRDRDRPPGGRPSYQRQDWRDRPARYQARDAAEGDEPTELLTEDEELIAGRRPVSEAFTAARPAKRLLVVPERRQALEQLVVHATALRIPIVEVEGGTLTSVAGFDGHQGIALVVEPRRWATLDDVLARAQERGESPFVLVLDSLEDPQNVGTLLRSAEAVGVHGVLFPTRRSAPIGPAAVKASAGATEHLLLVPLDDLAGGLVDLHGRGLRIVGADEAAQLSYRDADLRGPLALVVGSEGQGISGPIHRRLDLAVSIPMRGKIASLNASVAGSVLLLEAAGHRAAAEPAGQRGAAAPSPTPTPTLEPGITGTAEAAKPKRIRKAKVETAEVPSPPQPEVEPASSKPRRARKSTDDAKARKADQKDSEASADLLPETPAATGTPTRSRTRKRTTDEPTA